MHGSGVEMHVTYDFEYEAYRRRQLQCMQDGLESGAYNMHFIDMRFSSDLDYVLDFKVNEVIARAILVAIDHEDVWA